MPVNLDKAVLFCGSTYVTKVLLINRQYPATSISSIAQGASEITALYYVTNDISCWFTIFLISPSQTLKGCVP